MRRGSEDETERRKRSGGEEAARNGGKVTAGKSAAKPIHGQLVSPGACSPQQEALPAAARGGGAGRDGARVCARRQLVRVRARTPADAGADRIDNNLSIPLWKLDLSWLMIL